MPHGRERLKSWLDESEQNKQEYKDICQVWYATRWVRYISHISKNSAWNIIKLKREKERYRRRLYYTMSAAASVIILFGMISVLWVNQVTVTDKVEQVLVQNTRYSLQNINPTLILSSGRSIDLLELQQKEYLSESGVSVSLDSGAVIYKDESMFKLQKGRYNEVLVPQSRNLKVELADGTVVYLNSVSRLRYPVEFSGDKREVYLEGEAYFDVAKDAKHPFIVHTDKTDVKVLGTQFNVMTYDNEEQTQITLLEGSVEVKLADKYTTIKPGDQMTIDNKALTSAVHHVDVTKFTAWREGFYKFDSASLEQLLKYMERQYGISYFFEKESAKKLQFTGAFDCKSSVEEIFGMIEQMADVKFEMQQFKLEMQDGRKILIK